MEENAISKQSDIDIGFGWEIYRDLSDDPDSLPVALDTSDNLAVKKATMISLLFAGRNLTQASAAVGMSHQRAHIMMQHDDTFKKAYEMERSMRLAEKADSLERQVWERALDGDRKDSMLLAMYALKSRRPEYKDSHQAPSDNRVAVSISIDGQRFDAQFQPTKE